MDTIVKMDKLGRIIFPKQIREKYNLQNKTKFIIIEETSGIILIPIRKHKTPTKKLYGIIQTVEPINDPKKEARKHIKQTRDR